MKINNEMQKYIFDQEQKWFIKFAPFLRGKILKVGNGLGYFAQFIETLNKNITVLDIQKNDLANNHDDVIIYDGRHFPFENKTFDCVVCTYVLHHTPNPIEIIEEMRRVAKRIILIEITYTNYFVKCMLIYRDIFVNILAGQSSKIYRKSYFKRGNLEKIFISYYLKVINHQEEKTGSSWKELFILE